MKRRFRPLLLLTIVLALVASACGGDDDDSTTETQPSDPSEASIPEGDTITIGAQDFGESKILAELYAQALAAKGYDAEVQDLGGGREIVYTSFDSGDINFTLEYAASALEFLNEQAGEATPDADDTVEKLGDYLTEKDLTAAEPSPAVDSNAFVVTSETAEEHSLDNISDLADFTDARFGGPQDCPTNPFCLDGLKTRYDVDLTGNFTAFDFGGPLTKTALENGDVDVALLFSTDGAIAENDWVVLKDDKGMINADNVVPVFATSLEDQYGEDFVDFVNQVSAAITTEELTDMNRRFDIEREDADAIATDFLTGKNLLG
jgi:osmoprotectant transport system substrate-binding protein